MIEGKILVKKCLLNLKMMLEGGQCFRWRETSKNVWMGVVLNVVWTISQDDDYIEYKARKNLSGANKPLNTEICFEKNHIEDFLTSYLRLQAPLDEFYQEWENKDPNFHRVAKKCYGIRILDQHPVENLFSFICSSNNNITRISTMVEKLCSSYGSYICTVDGKDYYTFPEISKLSPAEVESELRQAGFGYRAKFIQKSAKQLENLGGLEWLIKLKQCTYHEAKAQLIQLPGIGAKVADCICLMSLGHMEALPVDTHVFQITVQNYIPRLKSVKTVTDKVYNEIGDYFRQLYGPLAGWAHTVLFCGDLKMFKGSDEPCKRARKHNRATVPVAVNEFELGSVSGQLKYSKVDLNLKITFISGQTYRFREVEKDVWHGVFAGKVWILKQFNDHIEYTVYFSKSGILPGRKRKKIHSSVVIDENWCLQTLRDYFRLDFPLQDHYRRWSEKDQHFKNTAEKFYGLRMLKQDIVENLFVFICSSNNTIARMAIMIEKLCTIYGDKIGEVNSTMYYDFPSVYKLSNNSVEEELKKAKFGFRAKYVHQSAKYIVSNGGDKWFKMLQTLSYDEAKRELMKLPGVAEKIADCICLTALDHLETIPVDTHVFQLAKKHYLPELVGVKNVTKQSYKQISDCFRAIFGDYAGWAHTVLFCSELKQHVELHS